MGSADRIGPMAIQSAAFPRQDKTLSSLVGFVRSVGRGTLRGWAFRGETSKTIAVPVQDEVTIEVRWPGGHFSVHGSPWDLEAFAVGHLISEGYVPSYASIRFVTVHPRHADHVRINVGLVGRKRTAGSRRDNVLWGSDPRPQPLPSCDSASRIRAGDLLALADALHREEKTLRAAGPLHWAALFDSSSHRLLLASDLSRHNAVDKVLGRALASELAVPGHILYSSGRVGEELAAKAIRVGAAALATRSVPFRSAVDLARRHGLLLLGKLRPGSFWVYAGKSRLARAGRRRGGPSA